MPSKADTLLLLPDDLAPFVKSGGRALIAILLVANATTLSGWLLDLPILCSFAPDLIGMKPNAAVCFILIGLALGMLYAPTASRNKCRMFVCLLALVPLVIGLLNIFEYLFQWDLRIDQLFVRDAGPVLSNVPAGRLAMGTAVGVVLIGIALLVMCVRSDGPWRVRALVVCGSLMTLIGLFSPIGYTYADPSLVGWWRATAMALPTALSLVLVGVVILLFAWHELRAHWTAERGIALGVGFTIVILAFLTVSSYLTDHQLMASYQTVRNSQAVVHQTKHMLLNVVELEAKWRGYLITIDKRALDASFATGMSKLDADLESLRSLTANDSDRRQHIAALERCVFQWRSQFEGRLALVPDTFAAVETQRALTRQSEASLSNLCTAVERVELDEEQLMAQRERTMHAAQQKALYLRPLSDALAYLAIIAGMVVVLRHISARKQAEAALAREYVLMQALMDHIPDQIYFKDMNSHFLKVNQSVADTLGVKSTDEVVGKTDGEFYGPADAAAFQADDQKVMEGGMPLRDRVEVGHTTTGERWMSTTKAPVFDARGNLIGLVGISRDITERKKAEEILRESEDRNRTVIESLTEGLVISDIKGQTLEWNRAALTMHGYATLEEARRELSEFADTFELAALDGTALPLDQWPLARILRGEELREFQVRIRRVRSNWQRVFSYGGTLVKGKDGQPRLAMVTVSDITERKRLEDELRRSATYDKLTGLFNRHQLDERFIETWRLTKRYSMPLCLCVCDLDNLKTINDTFGHQAGDRVLIGFADGIRSSIRESDFAGRFGGDEFCIVFPNTTAEQAQCAVQRIRAALAQSVLRSADGTQIVVTSSFGMASLQPGMTENEFFAAADKALYSAKQSGRDRMVLA